MSWNPKAYGTPVGGYGTPFSLNPAIPGSPIPGDIMLMATGVQMGDHAQPTISGWTNLTPSSTATIETQCLFGRMYTGSGDAPGPFNWSYNAGAYAYINLYGGGTLTADVTAVSNLNSGYTGAIGFGAITPVTNGDLIVAFGAKDTVVTSTSFSPPSGTSFNVQQQINLTLGSGIGISAIYMDWVQATAAAISAGFATLTPTDSSAKTNVGWVVALKAAVAAGGANQALTLLGAS